MNPATPPLSRFSLTNFEDSESQRPGPSRLDLPQTAAHEAPAPAISWDSEHSGAGQAGAAPAPAGEVSSVRRTASELTRRLQMARLSEDLGKMHFEPVAPLPITPPHLARLSTDAQITGDATGGVSPKAGLKRLATAEELLDSAVSPTIGETKRARFSAPASLRGRLRASPAGASPDLGELPKLPFGASAPW